MHRQADHEQTEEAHISAPLPLFRPEVLASQESFYGHVVRIRSFSSAWIALLILTLLVVGWSLSRIKIGGASIRMHGIVVGPVSFPAAANPQAHSSILIRDARALALHPGMRITLRCSDCVQPHSQWAASVLHTSREAASMARQVLPKTQTEVEVAILDPVAVRPVLERGMGLDLVLTVPQQTLKDWLITRAER